MLFPLRAMLYDMALIKKWRIDRVILRFSSRIYQLSELEYFFGRTPLALEARGVFIYKLFLEKSQ
jgi:hypothetical protein